MVFMGVLAASPSGAATLQEYGVHYAPVLYQDTADGFPNDWRNRRYDLVTRFDFDGNDEAADNWATAESWNIPAFVYYDAVETSTHVFLVYGFFHPRDWEASGCFYPLCHENDQENYRLTIKKDGTEFGTPILLDGDSHGLHHAFAIGTDVTSGRTNVSATAPSFEGSHVQLFLEAKGHGPQQCEDEADCLSKLAGGDGVVYRVTADGGAPAEAEPDVEPAAIVTAEFGLLASFEELWGRIATDDEEAFDATGAVTYQGGRYSLPFRVPIEWNSDDWGSEGDGHVTWGVEFVSDGGADRKLDWGLDPAFSVKEHFTVAGEYSLSYTCNPYLAIFDSCPDRVPETPAPGPGDPPDDEDDPTDGPWEPSPADSGSAEYPGCSVGCVSCSGGAAGAIGGSLSLLALGLVAVARRRVRA